MNVKIYDVAKRAGVSVGTVSRVFNGYTDISDETKKKVKEIAEKMGYFPNVAARTLSSKSLKTIAFIMNDLVGSRFDSVTMQTILGVYRYAEDHGMQFVLYPTSTANQSDKSFDQFCQERNIDGAIVIGLHTDDPYVRQIADSQRFVVTIDLKIDGQNTGSISIDNVQAEAEITELVLSHKRKNLVMLNGRENAAVSIQRELGFRRILRKFGVKSNTIKVYYENFDLDLARQATLQLLEEDSTIDGIVCASDVMALGALQALKSLGRKVPDEIEVTGFDNIAVAEFVDPGITTVDQHMEQMGYEAVHLLNKMMNNNDEVRSWNVTTPHKIIRRGSTRQI